MSRELEKCPYCVHDSMYDKMCYKKVLNTTKWEYPKHYVCTRPPDHEGPCVACSTSEHDMTGVMEANNE